MNIHKLHRGARLGRVLPFILSGFFVVAVGYGLATHKQSAFAATPNTCTKNGTFQSPSTGDAALTSADIARSEAAMAWIRTMARSKTPLVTTSTITMADYYSPTYKDDMYGTFTLRDRTYPQSGGTYQGIEFRQYVVADMAYYLGSAPAYTDGSFMFNSSNNGRKLIQLVDTNTDEVLAEYADVTGLVRSYAYAPGEQGYGTSAADRSFSYDQGLALFAAMGTGDDTFAKTLVDGILLMQTKTGPHAGGFVFSAPQLSPSEADPSYRTGSHSITTDALLAYIQKYPNDPDIETYRSAALAALAFIDKTSVDSGPLEGLYRGGYGAYVGAQQIFDPTFTIEWASTEHNIDIWHTLMRAAAVLNDTQYSTKAAALATAIMAKLYNSAEQRLNQGLTPLEVDTADPLDVNSWGAIQLSGAGYHDEAVAALARVSRFENEKNGVTGYAPFYSSGGYPGATETVWYEGTFGVALAHYRLGNTAAYRAVINNSAAGQEVDGSFRYATNVDTKYEIGGSRSMASTAWYVLITTARDSMWNNCVYTAPPITPGSSGGTPSTPPASTLVTPTQSSRPSPSSASLRSYSDAPAPTLNLSSDTAALTHTTPPPSPGSSSTTPPATTDTSTVASPSPRRSVLPLVIGAVALLCGAACVAWFMIRRRTH